MARGDDIGGWWPERIWLSPAQRALMLIFAVPIIPGVVIGLLGMLHVLGDWAELAGFLAVLAGVGVELTPPLIYWSRRVRARRRPR